jgi:hypothetical protein
MGDGLKRAFGAAAATDLTAEQVKFLRALWSWLGVASSRDLGPQTRQEENSARQRCKRRGLVTYSDGYWRLTDVGREALKCHERRAASIEPQVNNAHGDAPSRTVR